MSTPPRRHWFAFRLRTLLVVVVMMGCVLTPLAIKVKRARDQTKVVAWVLENGGTVEYDWQADAAAPTGPKWLRRVVGDDFFQTVRSVTFDGRQPLISSPQPTPKRLVNIQKLTDLSPLERLPGLRRLAIHWTRVHDLSPLAGMSQLEQLSISYVMFDGVSDLSPLKELSNLRELSLTLTQVRDLSPLQDLSGLQKLDLTLNRIEDLSPLKGLRQLEALRIGGTRVSDFSPVRGLTRLRVLDASGTRISDLSPLRELSELRELDLVRTEVRDLSPLMGLTKLRELRLNDAWKSRIPGFHQITITDKRINELQVALPRLQIIR